MTECRACGHLPHGNLPCMVEVTTPADLATNHVRFCTCGADGIRLPSEFARWTSQDMQG